MASTTVITDEMLEEEEKLKQEAEKEVESEKNKVCLILSKKSALLTSPSSGEEGIRRAR